MIVNCQTSVHGLPMYNITPAQQVVSSCSGALLTSLLTTPFDVVKVRLQAQQQYALTKPCYLMECSCLDGVTIFTESHLRATKCTCQGLGELSMLSSRLQDLRVSLPGGKGSPPPLQWQYQLPKYELPDVGLLMQVWMKGQCKAEVKASNSARAAMICYSG